MLTTPRLPFRDTSNAKRSPSSDGGHALAELWSSPIGRTSRKRQRLCDQENTDDLHPSTPPSKTKGKEIETYDHNETLVPARRVPLPTHLRLKAASLSTRYSNSNRPSTAPIIQNLVSSNRTDVYRIHSSSFGDTFDLPVSCSFSHGAKDGRTSLLSVTTEEGRVEIMNVARRKEWEQEAPRLSLQPHNGVVFDASWSADDLRLATSSGDKTICITDVERREVIASLRGAHGASVKQVQWNPHNQNLLAAASRDGSISLWDLREKQTRAEDGVHGPVSTILRAHGTTTKGRKTKLATSPTTASITSILYGKQRDNSLYSSSSANGIIKLWDLRDARSAIQSSEKSLDSTMRDITNHMSPSASLVSPKRARGICSMALDPSGSTIYAVAADSRIHQYSALTLQPPTSHVKNLTPHLPEPLSDPHLKVSSFYVRVAVSPCGQWLACGSSGGQVLVWSLGADFGSRTVILNPGGDNAGRETGAVDWASDGVLSSCSDDRTVRVWRPDVVTARSSRADVNGMATDWAVAS